MTLRLLAPSLLILVALPGVCRQMPVRLGLGAALRLQGVKSLSQSRFDSDGLRAEPGVPSASLAVPHRTWHCRGKMFGRSRKVATVTVTRNAATGTPGCSVSAGSESTVPRKRLQCHNRRCGDFRGHRLPDEPIAGS